MHFKGFIDSDGQLRELRSLFFIPHEEGLRIDLHSLGRNLGLDDLEPVFTGKFHVLCGHAEDDVVKDTGAAELQGFLHGVDAEDGVGLFQVLDDVLGIFRGSHDDADRVDAPVIDDEDAVFFEEIRVAQGFKALKGDEDICLSLLLHIRRSP